MAYDLKALKKQISTSVQEHSKLQTLDSVYYNASVVLAIACASAAGIFIDLYPLIAKILSAFTAIIVATDRALHFGERWIYHRQMRHEYLLILARIDELENMNDQFTEDEKKKYFLLIFDELLALKKKESTVPGVTSIEKTIKS
jgi:hypothetical protein